MSKKKTKPPLRPATVPAAPAAPTFWDATLLPFLARRSFVLAATLIALASLRIVSTYSEMSPTWDEPGHMACGLQYLAQHVYRYEAQHPPLARVMSALGPFLAGARPLGIKNQDQEGVAVMYHDGHPERMLTRMRLGILPFFVVAAGVVWLWARRHFGSAAAVLATGLFTLVPTVLAHGGMATTDMPLTACLSAAFFALLLWAEEPTWPHSLLLGAATALAVVSKFTALGFLPAAAFFAFLAYLTVERPGVDGVVAAAKARAWPAAIAVLTGALGIWAVYGFDFGKVNAWGVSLPAPELFDGVSFAMYHNTKGHAAYFLGEIRNTGWWYFFPVLLAVKTPLGWLVAVGLGLAAWWGKRARLAYWMPVAFAAGILLPGMTSHVNIGLRHILPIFTGLAILAALGLLRLLERAARTKWAGPLAALLVLWVAVSGALQHPDYLSYFNELAGSTPERIVVDSDLDWGQNIIRLQHRLRQLGAAQVAFGDVNLHSNHLMIWPGLPLVQNLDAFRPVEGWTAVSPTMWMLRKYGLGYRDLSVQPWWAYYHPVEKVGTLWLYYIPPGTFRQSLPGGR
ncbi:MAG: glycosyltransferase family 39 protein [Candidatus Solibacter sp.]|jgi:4-amino-4-deoxy-L-arabinose transferase-like glycosyltransferase